MDKGYTTVLKDMNHAGLSRGIQQVQGGVVKAVKRKKITEFVGDVDSKRMDKLSKAFGWLVGISTLLDKVGRCWRTKGSAHKLDHFQEVFLNHPNKGER